MIVTNENADTLLAEFINKKDNKKLNIAIFTDAYYPLIGGVTKVVESTANEIIKNNNVVVLTGGKKFCKADENSQYPVLRCKGGFFSDNSGYASFPMFDRKFKKIIKKLKIDVIHIHTVFTMATYALKIAKKRKIPAIITGHSKFDEEYPTIIKNKFISNYLTKRAMRVISKASRLFAVSENLAQKYKYLKYKKDIDIIRNATDFTYPDNAEFLIKQIREKHQLSENENIFSFVGRLNASTKNLFFLVDSLKLVKDKGINFKFIFIGDGPDRGVLERKIKEYNMQENFIFTGYINNRDLLFSYYLVSNLFLFPSLKDTSGLVKFEAAAMKVPTLALFNTAVAEEVIDNVNGFLCENDKIKFAEKVCEIVNNKALLKQVSQNAFRQLSYSWQDNVNKSIEVYKRLINLK